MFSLHRWVVFFQVRRRLKGRKHTNGGDVIGGYLNRLKGAEGAQMCPLFGVLGVCCDLLYFCVALQEPGCTLISLTANQKVTSAAELRLRVVIYVAI